MSLLNDNIIEARACPPKPKAKAEGPQDNSSGRQPGGTQPPQTSLPRASLINCHDKAEPGFEMTNSLIWNAFA
jgi:hypothetical protein